MNLKNIAATLILACVALTVSAQQTGKFYITPMAGVNLSQLSQYTDVSRRIGLTAGAELEYKTTPLYSFVAGLKYSQQGAKNTSNGYDEKFKLDYINIPLLVKFNLPQTPEWINAFSMKFGLEPGILINDKVSTAQGDYDISDSYAETAGGEVSVPSVALNLQAGLAYEYRNFVIDARYVVGLTNAIKITQDGTDVNIRHQAWMFTIGYKFAL